jgi:hypothetical protein
MFGIRERATRTVDDFNKLNSCSALVAVLVNRFSRFLRLPIEEVRETPRRKFLGRIMMGGMILKE